MQLTPERLTDIFDNAVNKSHHVNQRFARVDAMRLVLETIGILGKVDEEAKLANAYRALTHKDGEAAQ